MDNFTSIWLGFGSVVMALIGVSILYKTVKTLTLGVKTKGTIVSAHVTQLKQRPYYYPLAEFTAIDGTAVQCPVGLGGRSEKSVEIGKTVTLHYLPDQPEKAQLWSFWSIALVS